MKKPRYKLVRSNGTLDDCDHCALENTDNCVKFKCASSNRSDGIPVYLVKAEDSE